MSVPLALAAVKSAGSSLVLMKSEAKKRCADQQDSHVGRSERSRKFVLPNRSRPSSCSLCPHAGKGSPGPLAHPKGLSAESKRMMSSVTMSTPFKPRNDVAPSSTCAEAGRVSNGNVPKRKMAVTKLLILIFAPPHLIQGCSHLTPRFTRPQSTPS